MKLTSVLQKYNIPILGTSPESIDIAENREKFKSFLSGFNFNQTINLAVSEK